MNVKKEENGYENNDKKNIEAIKNVSLQENSSETKLKNKIVKKVSFADENKYIKKEENDYKENKFNKYSDNINNVNERKKYYFNFSDLNDNNNNQNSAINSDNNNIENDTLKSNDNCINFEYKDNSNDIIYEKSDKHEFIYNDKNLPVSKINLNEYEIKNILDENNDEDNKNEEKQLKNEMNNINFEKSYNDSLNNYLSSSFVDILNTMHENKKDLSNNNVKNYVNKNLTENLENKDLHFISCILCGDSIKANSSKMCNNCLLQNIESNSVNINKDTYLIYYCRECRRYLHNKWVYCELESKELLALCLKKVNKLKKLKILNAKFLYTEPHSKRIKIHLSVQEELLNNFISEMELILHYVIKYTQCDDCKKKYTPYTYNTCVSVRQKVDHKKTLLFLESLLLKYNMNENIINIVTNPDGLDFHFLSRNDALKFCDFILSKTISKCKNSKHLINHDASNNTYNYLYTFSIDICPICKYDLIFFPKDLSVKYGIKSLFYLCIHVSIFIILINPFCFLNNVHISQERYNKYPFTPLLSKADAKVFLILNVEYINNDHYSKKGKNSLEINNKNLNNIDDNNSCNNGNSNSNNSDKKKNNLKRKKKNSSNIDEIQEDISDDYDITADSLIDTKSCKSSSRKLKLDNLVYAYVELYDESNGSTILTKTCNAKHLRPGDYVNAYDLRKHTFDNEISLFLEKDDNYNIIIIDKVKSKEKQKIENELIVQNKNIETLKKIKEDNINRIILNNCKELENMSIT
ncbi:60S ribosomal export protein NMD3, putative [Plasmodium gallinaceum]|uniref:60S ribosomal export protein NMD3, putative n=1 Tax=Plasmodium gallinaceum TaxID=5849 RepID=A0A1J1GQD0_PLAGA|nr:60S ribosomal export protein NMD3, putative [Plasmodium gallinaceum]CRG93250.1 60S ribosomal export protein NMD3, putative [Plasmodium gallinaceum]